MEWTLDVSYKKRRHLIRVELLYFIHGIVKVKVYGKRSSFVIEADRIHDKPNSTVWTFKEGSINETSPDRAGLLFDIINGIEFLLKRDVVGKAFE